jgi:hypothetical protein
MRVALALSVALSAALASAPALADALVVTLDHSTRLDVRGQAASVLIGNPKVADVTVVDTHTLFVSGRGYGQTDVVVLDRAGRILFKGDVTVAAADNGLVSVYRGAQRTEFACDRACIESGAAPGPSSRDMRFGGSASTAGASGMTSSGSGGDASGLGGAISGVGSAAGSGAAGVAAMGNPG